MRPSRSRDVGAVFLIVWMVVWTAGMMVAVWYLGSAALKGEIAAGVVLAVWIAGAGLGLVSAARRLPQLLATGRPRRPDTRRWEDGIEPPRGG